MGRTKPNSRGMLPGGRKAGGGTFTRVPHALQRHPDYIALTLGARAFLVDLMSQYNGRNNGNLAAAEGVMGKLGYSKRQCIRYREELKERGWIEVTRTPRWPREPYLFRLTWIDVGDWTGEPVLDEGVRLRPRRSLQ